MDQGWGRTWTGRRWNLSWEVLGHNNFVQIFHPTFIKWMLWSWKISPRNLILFTNNLGVFVCTIDRRYKGCLKDNLDYTKKTHWRGCWTEPILKWNGGSPTGFWSCHHTTWRICTLKITFYYPSCSAFFMSKNRLRKVCPWVGVCVVRFVKRGKEGVSAWVCM